MPLRQVEPAASRLAVVVSALTDTLPKKSWRWDRPGWAGKTIGSSGADEAWLHFTDHTAWPCRSAVARWRGRAPAANRPITTSTPTARPPIRRRREGRARRGGAGGARGGRGGR